MAPIKDDRQVKRPVSSYIYYTNERRDSGDFKDIKFTEIAKLIGDEWKHLSSNQKKVRVPIL